MSAITISRNSATTKAWLVCMTAAFFFFYEFIQMGMFNALAPYLMREFKTNATNFGQLSSTFFYADLVFLLFSGIIIDHFSVRTIILAAMTVCTLATFTFAMSTKLLWLGVSHLMAGAGSAFCLLSCIKLSVQWFPSKQLAFVIGMIVTIGMMGGVFAQVPLAYLAGTYGWRDAVTMDGIIGIVIFLAIWFLVIEQPLPVKEKSSVNFYNISYAFLNKQVWLAGLYTSLLNLPIILLGELWGIMFLMKVRHLSHLQASYVTTMIFVGTIIGSPLVGKISDYWQSRKFPMIYGAIFSLLIVLMIIFVRNLSFYHLLFLFLLLGVTTSAQIITYPFLAETNPPTLVATATGFASVVIMTAAALSQPFFGWLMDLSLHQTKINGVIQYSNADYFRGMMIFPLAFLIGLIAAWRLRETHCLPWQDKN